MHIPYKEECCFLLDNGLKIFIYSHQETGCNKDKYYPEYDIVSRYKEPIDEDKLDELGYKYADSISHVNSVCNMLEDAYKAGYCKAMEE